MRSLVAALAALLVAAAPAQAGWKTNRAEAIAAIVWNNPCAGNVQFAWGAPTAFAATADIEGCRVVYSPNTSTEWPVFCSLMIHEYGHLAGYRDPLNIADPLHSHNPRSVMSASQLITRDVATGPNGHRVIKWGGVDPRCRKNGRPYLEEHGLL